MKERKTVLVTGSSRGLGAVTIKMFAKLGYNVIINYNNSYEEAEKLTEEISNNYNVGVLCLKGDISKEEDVIRMYMAIKEKFGSLDCLVNNAGISLDNDILSKTEEEFKKVIDTNLVGTFLVTKHMSNLINEGSIINITSTDGIDTSYVEEIDYAASKAGIISLTKTMAKNYAPKIRVNAIAAGWINTDMTKDLEESFKRCEEEKILLNRFASPEEVARVITFLASPDASYINGSIVRVDGGYNA